MSNQELIDKVFADEDFPTKPSINGKFFLDKSMAYVVGNEVRASFISENFKIMYYFFYFDHKNHLIVGTRFV